MANVSLALAPPDRVLTDVYFDWKDRGGFRPPALVIYTGQTDEGASVRIEISGDEIGRLRQVLNHHKEGI